MNLINLFLYIFSLQIYATEIQVLPREIRTIASEQPLHIQRILLEIYHATENERDTTIIKLVRSLKEPLPNHSQQDGEHGWQSSFTYQTALHNIRKQIFGLTFFKNENSLSELHITQFLYSQLLVLDRKEGTFENSNWHSMLGGFLNFINEQGTEGMLKIHSEFRKERERARNELTISEQSLQHLFHLYSVEDPNLHPYLEKLAQQIRTPGDLEFVFLGSEKFNLLRFINKFPLKLFRTTLNRLVEEGAIQDGNQLWKIVASVSRVYPRTENSPLVNSFQHYSLFSRNSNWARSGNGIAYQSGEMGEDYLNNLLFLYQTQRISSLRHLAELANRWQFDLFEDSFVKFVENTYKHFLATANSLTELFKLAEEFSSFDPYRSFLEQTRNLWWWTLIRSDTLFGRNLARNDIHYFDGYFLALENRFRELLESESSRFEVSRHRILLFLKAYDKYLSGLFVPSFLQTWNN